MYMPREIIDLHCPKLNWTDVCRVLMMRLYFVIYALIGVVFIKNPLRYCNLVVVQLNRNSVLSIPEVIR